MVLYEEVVKIGDRYYYKEDVYSVLEIRIDSVDEQDIEDLPVQ